MTTNVELIETLCTDALFWEAPITHRNKAADAIGALESKDLKWQEMADKAKGLIDELLIQRTVLQAEVVQLKDCLKQEALARENVNAMLVEALEQVIKEPWVSGVRRIAKAALTAAIKQGDT